MKSSGPFSGRRRVLAAVVLTTAVALPCVHPAFAAPIDDYNLAVKFFQQKRWAATADLVRDFLKASPDHEKAPLARLYLGQSLAQQSKYAEARDAFREFAKLHPQHPQISLALYRIGESSYFLGESDASEAELKQFVERFPEDSLAGYARLYLGETYLAKGDPATAVQQFEDVLKVAKVDSLKEDASMGLAKAQQTLGRSGAAVEQYTKVASSNGRRAAEALFAVGGIQYEQGDFEASRKAFEDFEKQFPGSPLLPTAQLNAGYAAYQLKDFIAARDRFNAASQRPDQALMARYWLALTNHAEKKFVFSRLDFAKIVDEEKDAPPELRSKALFYLGDSQLRSDLPEDAIKSFVRLVDEYPSSDVADNALHEATDAAIRIGDFAKATELNRRFEASYSNSPFYPRQKLLFAKAAVERLSEDASDTEAIAAAEKSLQSLFGMAGGLDERARVELARLYQTINRKDQAIEVLKPLLERPETDGLFTDARLMAASLYLSSDQPTETVRIARMVVEKDPRPPVVARQLLARAEAAQGNWPAAEKEIQQIEDGPSKTIVLVDAAESAFAAKQWEQAAGWFDNAVTDANAPVAAFSGLGYSRFEMKDFDAAAKAFASLEAKAAADRPLGSTAAWMRGLSLQSAEKIAEAQQVFEAGVTAYVVSGDLKPAEGTEVEVVANVYQMSKQAARIARDAGETDRSNRYYEVSVDQMRRLPADRQGDLDKLINEWALLAYESEQFERSDQLFALLLELTPSSQFADDANLYLAESAFFAGNVEKAQEAFAKLAASDRSDDFVKERSSVLLLDIAAETRDWKTLEKQAADFVARFPASPSKLYALFRKGEAELRTENTAAAVATLSTARDLANKAEDAEPEWRRSIWVFLAEAAVQRKEYDLVKQLSVEFDERYPASPTRYQIDEIVGRSLKNKAQFKEAREAFTKVTDSETGRRTETAAKSQLMIAETFLLEENYSEALKEYYKVYVNYAFPEYQAPALFQAASCDESLKQWANAAQTYEILISEFPTSEYATQAQAKLEAVKLRIP